MSWLFIVLQGPLYSQKPGSAAPSTVRGPGAKDASLGTDEPLTELAAAGPLVPR